MTVFGNESIGTLCAQIHWGWVGLAAVAILLLAANLALVAQIRTKTDLLSVEVGDRKGIETKLRLLTAAVEQSMEGTAIIDLDGQILFVNKAFAYMHGHEPEEILGKGVSVFHTPEQMPDVLKSLSEVRETGSFNGEIGHARRDGTTFLGSMYNTLLHDEAGEMIGIVGTLRDVTAIKEVENSLHEKQVFLQNVFDAIRDGISILDKDLNIVQVNCWMEQKYSAEMPFLGKKCYVVYHHRESPCPRCPSLRTLNTGQPHAETVPYETAGKKAGWMELYTFPFHDSQGNLIGVIEHVKDISRHKQTENILRQTRKKLARQKELSESIVRWSPAFFVAMSIEGTTAMMNEAMLRSLGYKASEVIGQNYLETFVPTGERESVAECFRQVLRQENYAPCTHELSMKDGRTSLVEWHYCPVFREGGDLEFFFGLGMDLTERNRLEAQLIHSQRMEALGKLAGGIAHDFNNLLTVIIGSNQLLLDELQPGSPAREEGDEVQKAAGQAAALTKQLLAFSRRQMLKQERLDLNRIVAEMEKLLRRVIGEDIEVDTVLGEDLGQIKADPTQIEQVVLNLVLNARDAMPEGGTIAIKTENVTLDAASSVAMTEGRPGNFVCLSISDTGTGVDPDILPNIFEPFFTTKKKGEGTGLGLSVVYGVVRQHEGWIHIQTRLGKGTTFYVYLPRMEAAKDIPPDAEVPKPLRGKNERVLIVEDEQSVRAYVRKLLGKSGYAVVEARDAEEALGIFERENGNFDLIFCDVLLPKKSGLQLAEQILAIAPHTRILLTSGYTEHTAQLQAIKEQGLPFLPKPYTIPELLHAFRSEIEGGKARR